MITHVVRTKLLFKNGHEPEEQAVGAWEDFNSANEQALGIVKRVERVDIEVSIFTVPTLKRPEEGLVVRYHVTIEDVAGKLIQMRRRNVRIELPGPGP